MKLFLNLNAGSIKKQERFFHLSDGICSTDVYLRAWQAVIISEWKEYICFRRLWSQASTKNILQFILFQLSKFCKFLVMVDKPEIFGGLAFG